MKLDLPHAAALRAEQAAQAAEQARYARWLGAGTAAGLALLTLLFVAYLAGLSEPLVPTPRLPALWRLPLAQFLAGSAMPTGWGWLAHVARGDVANLLGIVVLAGCSLPALLALLPLYVRRGDRVFAALCTLQVAVLLLAASGVLTAGH